MGFRLLTLGVVAAALASTSVGANPGILQGYGLGLSLQPGWSGGVLPGEIYAVARSGALVQLDEAVVSPQLYSRLPRDIRVGTSRFYVQAGGRKFFLYVHSTAALLAETDRVLRSVRVTPWSAPLAAPRFRSSPGWQVGRSGPKPLDHASVSAWASTVPYENSPVDLPPDATVSHIGARGAVVYVWVTRPGGEATAAVRKDPLDLEAAHCTRQWEGQVPGVMLCTLLSRIPRRYDVAVSIFVRERSRLPAVQAELLRLVLLAWPTRR